MVQVFVKMLPDKHINTIPTNVEQRVVHIFACNRNTPYKPPPSPFHATVIKAYCALDSENPKQPLSGIPI